MDVGVPGGKRGNVQTGGGDRVSTISLLGCSTSVALATGPTDEEEEQEPLIIIRTGTETLRGMIQHFIFTTNSINYALGNRTTILTVISPHHHMFGVLSSAGDMTTQ